LRRTNDARVLFIESQLFSLYSVQHSKMRVNHQHVKEFSHAGGCIGWVWHVIREDPSTSLASEGMRNRLWHGNEGGLASLFQVFDDCTDFRFHTAFSKMAFVEVAACFTECQYIQVSLIGLAVIERDFLYARGDEQ